MLGLRAKPANSELKSTANVIPAGAVRATGTDVTSNVYVPYVVRLTRVTHVSHLTMPMALAILVHV